MIVSVVGLRHEAIALREQVSFQDQAKFTFQALLQEHGIASVVIISTCNRSEVYIVDEQDVREQVARLYRDFFHLQDEVELHQKSNYEAIVHLFQVCAGLDSQLLGEDQILKQMKDAYAFAQQTQNLNKATHVLFQNAFHFAKVCKQQYRLSEHPLSTASVAMKLLKQKQREHSNIMVCGSGEVIQQCLPYLADAHVTMVLRNQEIGKTLQAQYPFLTICPLEHRYQVLETCDVVLSATASPHPLFRKEHMIQDGKTRLIFDMALPRDVEAEVKELQHYEVYDIDEIQQYLKQHEQTKQIAYQEAVDFAHTMAKQVEQELHHVKKEPIIAQMQDHLLSMADDTYDLLNQKLHLSNHEQKTLKKTLSYSYLQFLREFASLVKQSEGDALAVLDAWSKKEGDVDAL